MRQTIIFFFLLSLAVLSSCSETISVDKPGAFMGMTPTDTPRLLNPELLATSLEEYNGTFNPAGTEFYYTLNTPKQGVICFSEMNEAGIWSEPRVAEFSGLHNEFDPLFSPDGSRLYFSSRRPVNEESYDRSNVWFVERSETGWGEPVYVDLKGYGNFYSSLTRDGSIYFNVWNNGDMFKASFGDSTTVERLPDAVNSENGEGDPFVSPDEDYLIYRGYKNSMGNGDMFISFRQDGVWSNPQNLGEPTNSKAREMCPYVTTDGRFFIWASGRTPNPYSHAPGQSIESVEEQHSTIFNGEQNIYYISADFIENFRSTATFE